MLNPLVLLERVLLGGVCLSVDCCSLGEDHRGVGLFLSRVTGVLWEI